MAAPDPIFKILAGYRLSAALKAAVDLGLFTAIAKGKRSPAAIAKAIGAAERGVRIVLDALLPSKLIRKKTGTYSISALARTYLVDGEPQYLGPVIQLHGHSSIWNSFSDLASAARKGGSVLSSNAHSHDQKFWEDFVYATHRDAHAQGKRLVKHLGVTRRSGPLRVLDVACGSGMYGLSVAEANPDAEVTLLDRPNVLRHTRKLIAKSPAAKRVRFLSGDLFKTALEGPFDLIIASHILHHFSLAQCGRMIRKFAKALRPGGRVAIQEFIVDDARALRTRQLLFSLVMLVWTKEGEAYSFREIRRLLASNRFQNIRFFEVELPSQFVIAER